MSEIKKKKICIFLGSRANYSSLRPIMREIQNNDNLELILFIGASALLDKYGEVVELVEQDGFKPDEYIYMMVEGSNPATMAKSTGLGLIEIANLLAKHKPDLTLVVGDRHEMLSITIASSLMNIPVAHTMGGEISGTIDESIRHAITKFSHIHFPASKEAEENIIRMGENPSNVFNMGCPRIDTVKEILEQNYDKEINNLMKSDDGVGDHFDINGDFILVSQHPVTSEFGKGEQQIHETLLALSDIQKSHDAHIIMLWPNADAGSDEISRGIRKFREHYGLKNIRLFKNTPMHIYTHLMNKTKCLVGNSSSGIREGAFIGTPTVNIGTRQNGRTKSINVVDVNYDRNEIKDAIIKQIEHGKYNPDKLYGSGDTSKKIVEKLTGITIDSQKKLHY